MQSNINTGHARELGIGETEIEKRGLKLNFDAPLTAVASIDDAVGAGFANPAPTASSIDATAVRGASKLSLSPRFSISVSPMPSSRA